MLTFNFRYHRSEHLLPISDSGGDLTFSVSPVGPSVRVDDLTEVGCVGHVCDTTGKSALKLVNLPKCETEIQKRAKI